MTIQQAWNERCRLHAEGDKLRAEGDKLRAEGDKLYAEGDKLHAEGRKLHAEGDKLYAEGSKLYAEGSKLYAEGDKLYAEGDKLRAEGDLIFINAVIGTHGPKAMIEYLSDTTVTVNGERYEYQQEKAEVVQEESPKVAIPDSKAFDVNQLAALVAKKVWEAMPKMVRLDYETKEALNEYARGKRDGAKEERDLSKKEIEELWGRIRELEEKLRPRPRD